MVEVGISEGIKVLFGGETVGLAIGEGVDVPMLRPHTTVTTKDAALAAVSLRKLRLFKGCPFLSQRFFIPVSY